MLSAVTSPDERLCPYCGAAMEQGFVMGREGVGWSDGHRELVTGVERLEILAKGVIRPAKLPAHRCVKCRVITASY